MDTQAFHDYIAHFNENEYDGFGNYYVDDAVFELGDRKRLTSRGAILDFYRDVHEQVRETLEVETVIVDDTELAAELRTEFDALEDAPDFIGGSMKEGESLEFISFVHYRLHDGKFSHIKSTRYKTL